MRRSLGPGKWQDYRVESGLYLLQSHKKSVWEPKEGATTLEAKMLMGETENLVEQ